MNACVRRLGAAVYLNIYIFRGKCSFFFFFLLSLKRKKGNQVVCSLWDFSEKRLDLVKTWQNVLGVFCCFVFGVFSTPQNYAVPSRVQCFTEMYQIQWKGFCMAHFCELWFIFVTSERRYQIKNNFFKKVFLIWKDTFTQFHLWCWNEGFGSVPAQSRNTWQNELVIIQKVQLENHRSVPAWHLCGWAST